MSCRCQRMQFVHCHQSESPHPRKKIGKLLWAEKTYVARFLATHPTLAPWNLHIKETSPKICHLRSTTHLEVKVSHHLCPWQWTPINKFIGHGSQHISGGFVQCVAGHFVAMSLNFGSFQVKKWFSQKDKHLNITPLFQSIMHLQIHMASANWIQCVTPQDNEWQCHQQDLMHRGCSSHSNFARRIAHTVFEFAWIFLESLDRSADRSWPSVAWILLLEPLNGAVALCLLLTVFVWAMQRRIFRIP